MPSPAAVTRCTLCQPGACPVCHQDHAQAGPLWTCADHGHGYVYLAASQLQEYWGCPEKGCVRGRWVS